MKENIAVITIKDKYNKKEKKQDFPHQGKLCLKDVLGHPFGKEKEIVCLNLTRAFP